MASETLKATPKVLQQMKHYYKDYLVNAVPYSEFQARKNGVVITGYTSGKVLFQGNYIEEEVNYWRDKLTSLSQAKPASTDNSALPTGFANWAIIGSDEVGTGSYFGALTVCAVFLPPERMDLMRELGVKDSKLLNDTQIRELAWQIKACVPHFLSVCPPIKYNEVIDTLNAVGIKVALHNFVIRKLVASLTDSERQQLQGVLIDQFTSPANYYKHLKREAHPYTSDLYFAQKGESHHLAVACASIIARAAFLESLETLGKPYGAVLPSGAGANVDQFGRQLVRQYGSEALTQTAKLHFANTKKILGKI
ncbi:ribonuclease HIII [Aerococcaceae bacterium NML190073]|nr:ribonuclease HIII [Aerococcaceae bacterium NML190073]